MREGALNGPGWYNGRAQPSAMDLEKHKEARVQVVRVGHVRLIPGSLHVRLIPGSLEVEGHHQSRNTTPRD